MENDLYLVDMIGSCLNRVSRESQLLPQPVDPMSKRLFLQIRLASTTYPSLIVSTVGINLLNIDPDRLNAVESLALGVVVASSETFLLETFNDSH